MGYSSASVIDELYSEITVKVKPNMPFKKIFDAATVRKRDRWVGPTRCRSSMLMVSFQGHSSLPTMEKD
jgi:hypothetical protein